MGGCPREHRRTNRCPKAVAPVEHRALACGGVALVSAWLGTPWRTGGFGLVGLSHGPIPWTGPGMASRLDQAATPPDPWRVHLPVAALSVSLMKYITKLGWIAVVLLLLSTALNYLGV